MKPGANDLRVHGERIGETTYAPDSPGRLTVSVYRHRGRYWRLRHDTWTVEPATQQDKARVRKRTAAAD